MTESTDDRIYSLMLKQQNHREKHNSLLLTEKKQYSYFNRNQSIVFYFY